MACASMRAGLVSAAASSSANLAVRSERCVCKAHGCLLSRQLPAVLPHPQASSYHCCYPGPGGRRLRGSPRDAMRMANVDPGLLEHRSDCTAVHCAPGLICGHLS